MALLPVSSDWKKLHLSQKEGSSTNKPQLRLRIFAGPNGSGKSTVIEKVRQYRINDRPIDFGIYINADNLALQLINGPIDLTSFQISATNKEFRKLALDSGLIGDRFSVVDFYSSYTLRSNNIRLKNNQFTSALAQVIADFIRKKLLIAAERFSFETVFSHESKLEIMQQAAIAGYKVYLYFVATEFPEINVFRVRARVAKGGHDVDDDKIVSRYYRSLELLYEACQLAYQAYFFDNSTEGESSTPFAHFKVIKGKKKWDKIDRKKLPVWFGKYYTAKI